METRSDKTRHTRRHEYVVRYRRLGWKERQARFWQSEDAALRFAGKLTSPDAEWWHLDDLVELFIERRQVGRWELHRDLLDDDDEAAS